MRILLEGRAPLPRIPRPHLPVGPCRQEREMGLVNLILGRCILTVDYSGVLGNAGRIIRVAVVRMYALEVAGWN